MPFNARKDWCHNPYPSEHAVLFDIIHCWGIARQFVLAYPRVQAYSNAGSARRDKAIYAPWFMFCTTSIFGVWCSPTNPSTVQITENGNGNFINWNTRERLASWSGEPHFCHDPDYFAFYGYNVSSLYHEKSPLKSTTGVFPLQYRLPLLPAIDRVRPAPYRYEYVRYPRMPTGILWWII